LVVNITRILFYQVISHEHFDHWWGVEVPLKLNQYLDIVVPEGFSAQGVEFIKKKGHKGALIRCVCLF
jgi:7,8-dihydropterin-6-yl-methyl-4-(beta-D-ribofuranosyl)aminobenzene 5'-phosphate synthase